MALLIAGLIIFLGIHSIRIFAPAFRDDMVRKLGEPAWKGIYSLISLAGFVLIVMGYGDARLDPVPLYTPPTWLRHGAMLLLLPVFPLLVATYLPSKTKVALRHPMLVAVKLWALAHLLANGTLADVLLFGGFLAWAIVDRISVKRRALVASPTASPSVINDVIVWGVGLAIYVVFVLWGHTWLIGVSPIGR